MRIGEEFNHIGKGGEDRTQHPKDLVPVPAHNPVGNQITFPKSGDSSPRNSHQHLIPG